ncbi:hypothetical protein FHU38_004233 [Saccharomonospora amisosensis]|uniref:Uncharacterized protein n=1 Tax=Saccharomonospora amisosensis TaxID=1128677 RepID=A0A7X5UUE8_9PSEU|nr:hypothetical protein [Saccharomonospora amisosensis]NIJ13889.1 hypothetical protein [Saccharomonospora amisosensis]
MPIRTNRGRAAVYRRLWGWPLRSPVHLFGTVVLVVAVIVAAGIVVPRLLGPDGGTGATPPGSAAGSTSDIQRETGSSRLPTRLSEPLASPTTAPPDPEALRVAREWATRWATHPEGTTIDQWIERLRPYTTEEYLPRMRSVNLANIPATRVTGEPKATNSFTSSVDVEVSTDGPTLLVSVVRTDKGWRVAGYDQVG